VSRGPEHLCDGAGTDDAEATQPDRDRSLAAIEGGQRDRGASARVTPRELQTEIGEIDAQLRSSAGVH
jgi:hypothetical protein